MTLVRGAALFLALCACVPAAGNPAPPGTATNAALLAGFADALLVQHRTEYAFDSYVSSRLIQHNAAALDGRAAAIALVRPIIGAPGAQFAVSSLIADGDFGFLFYRGTLGASGGAAAVAELYRIEGGKFVEHWDAFQPLPRSPAGAHKMFGILGASLPTPCTGATPRDRAVIAGFADLLYRQRNVRAAFERYAAPDMIQHDPGLPDGRDAAIGELAPILSRPATRITIAHVLVCHGMGVIHLRSQYGDKPGHVIFDIMRMAGGRIVEHWDVFQPVSVSGTNPRPPI
jgi:predicted SnoaL-like aldol condensation-catalyzing enzyme